MTPPASITSVDPAAASVPFSQGHRRNASDTQAFHNMVHGKDNNPFLNNCTGEFSSIQEYSVSQPQLQARVAGWNPFEDQVSFGSMSEDNIFGAEFDRMRVTHNWAGDVGYAGVSAPPGGVSVVVVGGPGGAVIPTTTSVQASTAQRRDPFGSAPFAMQGGNV